ncbi:GMC family oxidoreductase [Halobacteriales archaeon QS_4_69_34]|nr:MAG: GMC family oxidoreductase [Halobacteriales archaeon QS_4_69_34]
MATETDVVVVGAGGDGPAIAWRLGQLGIDTLVLEAGPFHGNENWPEPHEEPGAESSADPADLSGELLEEQFTRLENDTNNPLSGKLRFGPADRCRGPWYRAITQAAILYQVAGVGGTTLHYLGNHPRALPLAVDEQGDWPEAVSYADLVPYYQHLEATHPIEPAPKTAKEELYFQGASAAGYDLLDGWNVTEAGYRPQPNAILRPDEKLRGDYQGDFTYPDVEGSTLAGHEFQGDPTPFGAPYEEKARRSSNVSLVPRAMETGNVTIRPNAFVTDVLTSDGTGTPEATGVTFRDTWSGDTEEVTADVVVLAAGAVETPRLWLNAGLPATEWVGKGMTTHYFDYVVGVFDEDVLEERLGQPNLNPHVGQNSAARFDKPGVGGLEVFGGGTGLQAVSNYGFSAAGYSSLDEDDPGGPWDTRGRIVGSALKEKMADYRRTLSVLVLTDDRPRKENGVSLDPTVRDEHGPVPRVEWEPSADDERKRTEMAEVATEILRSAGASHVHRADWPPLLLHLQSTMGMGKVTDAGAEAKAVTRLFVGDHSVLPNALGGPNPTHTGQAVALRTAETIADRYFPGAGDARIRDGDGCGTPGPDVTGDGAPARDPDCDGLYEDVDGDGRTGVVDAQALFAHREDRAVRENPRAFDFDDDGSANVVDVQKLFTEVID